MLYYYCLLLFFIIIYCFVLFFYHLFLLFIPYLIYQNQYTNYIQINITKNITSSTLDISVHDQPPARAQPLIQSYHHTTILSYQHTFITLTQHYYHNTTLSH